MILKTEFEPENPSISVDQWDGPALSQHIGCQEKRLPGRIGSLGKSTYRSSWGQQERMKEARRSREEDEESSWITLTPESPAGLFPDFASKKASTAFPSHHLQDGFKMASWLDLGAPESGAEACRAREVKGGEDPMDVGSVSKNARLKFNAFLSHPSLFSRTAPSLPEATFKRLKEKEEPIFVSRSQKSTCRAFAFGLPPELFLTISLSFLGVSSGKNLVIDKFLVSRDQQLLTFNPDDFKKVWPEGASLITTP